MSVYATESSAYCALYNRIKEDWLKRRRIKKNPASCFPIRRFSVNLFALRVLSWLVNEIDVYSQCRAYWGVCYFFMYGIQYRRRGKIDNRWNRRGYSAVLSVVCVSGRRSVGPGVVGSGRLIEVLSEVADDKCHYHSNARAVCVCVWQLSVGVINADTTDTSVSRSRYLAKTILRRLFAVCLPNERPHLSLCRSVSGHRSL